MASLCCSLPQSPTPTPSSFLQHPCSGQTSAKAKHGKLLLLSTLSLSNINSKPNTLNLIQKKHSLPTKPNYNYTKDTQQKNKKKFKKDAIFVQKNTIPITERVEKKGTFQVTEFVERIRKLVPKDGVKVLDGKDISFLTLEDFNSLLISLMKADELDWAVRLFNEISCYGLSPDSQTFFAIVKCYCKKNDPDEAKRVIDQMVEAGLSPNVVTCTIIISLYCKRGRVKKAFEVFEVMSKVGCEPTIQTYNCLISGLCYVGKVEEAFELLMKIKKSSKIPDIYTYSTVMDGFCKVGRSDEGMELLEEAVRDGLKPNVVTFNTLFDGYCKEGRPLEGISLLKKMEEMDCRPDNITYSTLLHGLLKWGKVLEALKVYKEMFGGGVRVDERIVNTLLRGICRRSWSNKGLLDDVEEVFEQMKKMGFAPYPTTLCLVIETFSMRGETEKAVTNLHEMINSGCIPRVITFNAVIQALCTDGRVDDALLVLISMNKLIFNPPCGLSYNLLICEFKRQGRMLDASKVHAMALKQGRNRRRTLEE